MHNAYWNVLVWVLLTASVILLILGVWEISKQVPLSKLIGTAWLAFAICIGCVAVGLNSANRTWHIRNAQKPWRLILMVNSTMLISGMAGIFVLARVTTLLKVTEGKLSEMRSAEDETVWPPAPRKL